jgi:hypothetical protein
MKRYFGVLLVAFLPACGVDDLPTETEDGTDIAAEQSALDKNIRSEPDQSWDLGIDGRDITWRYISFRRLKNSISVIGVLNLTLVNTDREQDLSANVLIRLRGSDGFQHFPETPLNQVHVLAGNIVEVSENFILEVKDPATANAISSLNISLF